MRSRISTRGRGGRVDIRSAQGMLGGRCGLLNHRGARCQDGKSQSNLRPAQIHQITFALPWVGTRFSQPLGMSPNLENLFEFFVREVIRDGSAGEKFPLWCAGECLDLSQLRRERGREARMGCAGESERVGAL